VLAVLGVRGRCSRWSRVVVLVLPLGKRAAGEQEKCGENGDSHLLQARFFSSSCDSR
jgi:hypothetical protein